MRWKIFLILLFIFLSLPSFALADTIISSPISTDTVWSPSGGVYIIDSSFSIASGTILTIEPGTIIKAKNTGMLGQGILGNLVAHGTNEAPIIFTSFWDDSVGGDTDGGGPSVSIPGEWQGLYFKEGSEGDFDYVNISYAGYGGYGYGYGDFIGIENDGGILNIRNSNIYDNYKIINNGGGGVMSVGSGIYNKRGTLFVSNSVIENNVWGIRVDSGTSTIFNNVIKDNIDSTGYSAGYGIYAIGFEPLTLLNNTFLNNKRTAYVDASKNFIHSGNTSDDQTNRGFEINGVITNNSIFHSGDLPFIVSHLNIEAGGTLTVEPGAILKMNDYYSSGNIVVYGNLIAKGTPEKKIYITSLRDDSIGGDTNGDGENTIPAPKNWNAIFLENGSKVDFDNVVLKYGGYNYNSEYLLGVAAAIYDRGAEFSVSNSLFERNGGAAIYQDAGTTTISHSEFANGDYGIWSRGGDITISQSNIYNNTGWAVYNESGRDLGWWWETRPLQIIDARNNWWGSSDGPKDISTTTPTGTGDIVSENVLYKPFLTEPSGSEPQPQSINPVIIIPGIMGSAYKNGELVIDPILHTYDDLIATLEANGYEKNKDLFPFPYEWRDSNVITANLLKDKIAEVKASCSAAALADIDCSKVDIVAHSMGGLVARQYIQSGQYQNDVDQLIFLGTPHKGSQKAYLQWEGGEFPPGTVDSLIELYFKKEALSNFYLSLFSYIHNRPVSSVQELLPIFDYLKDKDTGIIRQYPSNYPQNIFLESLDNNISNLLNSGVEITNIIGNTGNNSINKIIVVPSVDSEKWVHGEADNFELGIGDGTVTVYGATLDNSISNEEWNGVSHLRLPRETSSRIFNILTDKVSDSVIYLSPIEKIFSIQLQSPIDVVVTEPDGKRIGKNFETGEEYNEILGAFYSGFNNNDDEYITIPNPLDGEYKIEVQGTEDGGRYGIVTSFISDEFATSNEMVGITTPDQITDFNVVVDNNNPQDLETEKEVTLEILINDINGAYDLGWIKDKKVRDRLIKQVEKIIKVENKIDKVEDKNKKNKRIKKLESRVDKNLARALLLELNGYKKDKINEQAYNIIKYDLEWLIDN
ncbi:MAG: hypothetical protein UR80_C0016G0007 [Parcubacteria group bacterium GW2011_GWB1_35_5]|nr:MAG: PGAP1 family protein [Parcubacteria group bacterium GW2011_GWC1_34_10]KKP80868.1 MAG: hypothetical protein UR80_C0016G0007 [Parcubacteria group bacterium GW2011_GWB1_35_5]OHA87445.1 MAG: hypothetical protein A2726_00855 [Candidatus Zambryskibacteria bacterium RIFCSPHIGHO2_01_FULL_35_32]